MCYRFALQNSEEARGTRGGRGTHLAPSYSKAAAKMSRGHVNGFPPPLLVSCAILQFLVEIKDHLCVRDLLLLHHKEQA